MPLSFYSEAHTVRQNQPIRQSKDIIMFVPPKSRLPPNPLSSEYYRKERKRHSAKFGLWLFFILGIFGPFTTRSACAVTILNVMERPSKPICYIEGEATAGKDVLKCRSSQGTDGQRQVETDRCCNVMPLLTVLAVPCIYLRSQSKTVELTSVWLKILLVLRIVRLHSVLHNH